jgi:5-methylcytosine-specific restriction endonuclease McrA
MHDEELRQYQANGHAFGPGKTHLVDESQKTLCGRLALTAECPGKFIEHGKTTCMVCAKAVRTTEEREVSRLKWEAEAQARAAERERENAEWWAQYTRYLQTPGWAAKRAAVLERDRGRCQACWASGATQIHHLTYEHVFNELLFELVAVCKHCHDRITEEARARRVESVRLRSYVGAGSK